MDWHKFLSRKISIVAAAAYFLSDGVLDGWQFAIIAAVYLVMQGFHDIYALAVTDAARPQ